ncbi:ribonuclease H-like domain-containing protein [Tanacetum coccineum]|uniref:Ribonuclease H-like domain-containing protein n=1 Tax=Tanacetum coccineum TaxID=301880 RepID=A0ABQ5BU68_9ASTR
MSSSSKSPRDYSRKYQRAILEPWRPSHGVPPSPPSPPPTRTTPTFPISNNSLSYSSPLQNSTQNLNEIHHLSNLLDIILQQAIEPTNPLPPTSPYIPPPSLDQYLSRLCLKSEIARHDSFSRRRTEWAIRMYEQKLSWIRSPSTTIEKKTPMEMWSVMRSSLDFNKKFYNSLGRAPNHCSSSIGKTRGVVIVHSRNRLGRLDHDATCADSEYYSGADKCPTRLEKGMYDSWKSRMELYMMNRQHGRMILESIENGPLIWPSIEKMLMNSHDAINHIMSFLSAVVISHYPTTNNQLRNSSNPRQQATINDGRITLQPETVQNSSSSAQQDALILSVIVNGDAPTIASASAGTEGPIPPKTAEQKLARKNELKAKSTLLLAIPDEHLLKFHGIKDAKTLWEAINGSQLEIHGEVISQEDANLKLLRSLPSAWNNTALIMRNKSDLDTMGMDDLYNNMKVYESKIKCQSSLSSKSQNVAFVSSENTSSTNEAVYTAHEVSTASLQGQASSLTYAYDVMIVYSSRGGLLGFKSIILSTAKRRTARAEDNTARRNDHALWEVIVNGDSFLPVASASTGAEGPIPPKTAEQKQIRKNELKAKSTLMLAIPDEHLLKFHACKDAKSLWEAIKNRFGVISQEDANLKLLRSLPSAWNNIALIMRNKYDLDTLSMDDLYNNMKVYEYEIKGKSSSSSNSQNVAFVSFDNSSSTNKIALLDYEIVNTAHSVSAASSKDQASTASYADDVMFSFFANQSNAPQLDYKDLEHIDAVDLEKMDLKWQVAMLTMRVKRFIKKTGRKIDLNDKETVGFDRTKVKCYNCHMRGHFARECRVPRNQGNRNRDAPRRNALVDTSTTNALVVQSGE